MAFNLANKFTYIKAISIFENETNFYLVGEQNLKHTFNIISIKKVFFTKENLELLCNYKLKDILVEYENEYSTSEYKKFIKKLSKQQNTDLQKKEDCFAIFGFIKFNLGYYIIIVSEYSKIGRINKYIINRADKIKILPLFTCLEIVNEPIYKKEEKYLSTLKAIDFNKQLYFSFTYNLTKTVQRNFIENFKSEVLLNYKDNFLKETKDNSNSNTNNNSNLINDTNNIIDTSKNNNTNESFKLRTEKKLYDLKKINNDTFLWNHYHIKEFFNLLNKKIWCNYFIYGFFNQIEASIYGLRFLVTVLARRNRHYAGTRYLKRGINNDGNVANDVETEQILEEVSTSCTDQPNISSFIHIRGSVPLFWHQDHNSILPKPDIKLNLSDYNFKATKRHFYLLEKRYGLPSLVCNLTKKKEGKKKQETLLNEWYEKSVNFINKNDNLEGNEKIEYYHYDLKYLRKLQKFYKIYCDESCKLVSKTNMFCFIPHIRDNNTYLLSLQNGVIRSNCIDCLDRTNVYQQIIGTAVMVIQLRNLGIEAYEPDSEYEEIYGILTEIYKQMGNELSTQYAGSQAHKQTIKDQRSKVNKIIDKVPEMINTFKRYFNNTYNDQSKQNAINLFLGKFIPNRKHADEVDIWDVVSDVDLHKKKNLKDLNKDWAKEGLNYYVKYNLICDIYDKMRKIHTITTKKELFELGKDFNLDIIDKIKIKRINKKIPILTSQKYKEFYENRLNDQYFYNDFNDTNINNTINKNNDVVENNITTSTYDYLICLNDYIKYKHANPMKYLEQLLYSKQIPIFSFLDIEPKAQIQSFETFNYSNYEKNGNKNVDNNIELEREGGIDLIYDQTEQKGITSSQIKIDNGKIPEKKMGITQKNSKNEENINNNDNEEENFNICSFTLEDNLKDTLKNFCKFDFSNSDYQQIDNFEDNSFYDFNVYKNEQSHLVNDTNDFVHDLLTKRNCLEYQNKLKYENNNQNKNNKGFDVFLIGNEKNINRIQYTKQKDNQNSNFLLENFFLPIIDEEYFPL